MKSKECQVETHLCPQILYKNAFALSSQSTDLGKKLFPSKKPLIYQQNIWLY